MNNPIAICVDRNPFKNLEQLISIIGSLGFAAVEWLEPGPEERWTTPETAGEILRLSRQKELRAQYHAPYVDAFDLGRQDDGPRAPESVALTLAHMLDRAERIGAHLMTAHLGTCAPAFDRAEALCHVMEGIRLIAPELEKRRIRLALENHTAAFLERPLGDRPEDFDYLLGNIRSEWVGQNIDIGHAHVNGHIDEFLSRALDRVFNMHLHDNHGESDEHLALGRGTAPWETVFSRLAGACYRGPFTLEFLSEAEDYLAAIGRIREAN